MQQLVIDARRILLAWANEGLFTIMKLVSLDMDGDGSISAEEVAKYEEHCKALVDGYLGYFTSDGVVTALVLSIIYPLCFSTYGEVHRLS